MKNNVIYYLIITWYGDDEQIMKREFWDLQSAYLEAKQYEEQQFWRRIEIFKSTKRKKAGEIQPDKLYYTRTN